jgi:hypothetical protein
MRGLGCMQSGHQLAVAVFAYQGIHIYTKPSNTKETEEQLPKILGRISFGPG